MSNLLTEEVRKRLAADPDGLVTYEYIANNIETLSDEDINALADNIIDVDLNGQFTASAARYLHAISGERNAEAVRKLVAATIDRDREHRYLADLLNSLWGPDYAERAEELKAADNNFRRIYKRLFPTSSI